MIKPLYRLFLAIWVLLTASCNPLSTNQAHLEITNAWVRAVSLADGTDSTPTNTGVNSAVYLTIVNSTGVSDNLLAVECDAAEAVEIHETQIENDIMSMHPVAKVGIPSGGSIEFKPGGLHIMLVGLKLGLVAGKDLPLTLVFETAGRITVQAEIRNE